MSTTYDNTDTFVLFIADKGDNDKRPDRTGSLNVGGVEYFMDGWIKRGKEAGRPFLSGKIKRKDAQGNASGRAPPTPAPVAAQEAAFADDDIGF